MRVAVCALNGQSGHEAGRSLLEKLYREETGEALPEIRISTRGKPYFPNSPFYFSISHTPKHAFCVLARTRVGIDAEELERTIHPRLVERAFSPAERDRVMSTSDPYVALLTLWVLKEADAKRTGEGLRGFPNHTDFCPEDRRVRHWAGCVVAIVADSEEEGVIYHAF